VFYLPDLATNDYELLHSDAIGEINDPSWEAKLLNRNSTINDPDQIKNEDYFGGKSDEYYKNPH
jgi:hypothetical protein